MTLSECDAIATKKSTHIVQQLHVPLYPCTAVPCTRMASYTVQRTQEASTVFSLLMFWSINDKRCTSLSNAFSDATDGKFSIPNIFAEKKITKYCTAYSSPWIMMEQQMCTTCALSITMPSAFGIRYAICIPLGKHLPFVYLLSKRFHNIMLTIWYFCWATRAPVHTNTQPHGIFTS